MDTVSRQMDDLAKRMNIIQSSILLTYNELEKITEDDIDTLPNEKIKNAVRTAKGCLLKSVEQIRIQNE